MKLKLFTYNDNPDTLSNFYKSTNYLATFF